MKIREFNYINDIGREKKIEIYDKDDDRGYWCVLWDMASGACCGTGFKSGEKVNQYLDHYHIKGERVPVSAN